MAVTIQEITRAWQNKLDGKQNKPNVAMGRLVSVNGTVTPPNRPNFVYFLEFNQNENAPPAVVFNDAVQPVNNLPVLVMTAPTPPFRRKVIGVYSDELFEATQDDVGYFSVPPHATTHQYPSEINIGTDPVLVYQPALQMLKVTANASTALSIDVGRLIYHWQTQKFIFGGATALDISSYIPGTANFARYVLVYLDPLTNTIAFESGTAVDTTFAVPLAPDFVDPSVPAAYIYLLNGAATISNTDIVDARYFLNTYTTDLALTPRRVGDFLVSLDGITFEAQEILVDQHGEIITDSNGHFVTY